MRGTVTLGGTSPRATFRIQAGAEKFDNYKAGAFDVEDTRPLFADGTLTQADTIDTNFGFNFSAFPDPFNAPYRPDRRRDPELAGGRQVRQRLRARSSSAIAARCACATRAAAWKTSGSPTSSSRSSSTTPRCPNSNLDKFSARYEAQAITPWLANLSMTAYYQRTERLLQTTLPVQFPAPTAVAFFPITVFRLDILSETEQRVWTPGVDLHAVFVPAKNHLLTSGLTFYRDRSSDQRTTTTQMSLLGQVALGARGPAPAVFPSPVALGPPSIAHPVRVPDASLRDIAVFAQDEWRVRADAVGRGRAARRLLHRDHRGDAGLRRAGGHRQRDAGDRSGDAARSEWRDLLAQGAHRRHRRRGEPRRRASIRSCASAAAIRHPNLEEMLFAGPATSGSLLPNVTVEPETGNNFDAGVKFRAGSFSGGAYYFFNQYQNFIAQDLVVASNAVRPAGAGAQLRQRSHHRRRAVGRDADHDASRRADAHRLGGADPRHHHRGHQSARQLVAGRHAVRQHHAVEGDRQRALHAVARTLVGGVRRARAGRSDARGETLLDSPFLIAQDLLSLDGFAIQRAGAGINLSRGRDRVGLTFAVENLTDEYYREQFQFAPARGRSFTIGLNVGAF